MDKVALRKKFDLEHPVINRCINNMNVPIVGAEREALIDSWVDSYIDTCFDYIRLERNGLLASSDWTQVVDSPADKAVWAEYRQLLRDFPETITTVEALENPVWPTPPA